MYELKNQKARSTPVMIFGTKSAHIMFLFFAVGYNCSAVSLTDNLVSLTNIAEFAASGEISRLMMCSTPTNFASAAATSHPFKYHETNRSGDVARASKIDTLATSGISPLSITSNVLGVVRNASSISHLQRRADSFFCVPSSIIDDPFVKIGRFLLRPLIPMILFIVLFVTQLVPCCHWGHWFPRQQFETRGAFLIRRWQQFRRSWRTISHLIVPACAYHIRNLLFYVFPAFLTTLFVIDADRSSKVAFIGIAIALWAEVFHMVWHLLRCRWAAWRASANMKRAELIPGVTGMAGKFTFLGVEVRKQRDFCARIGATRTIGLFGEWGCGKSTFMRQVESELVNDPNVIAIYYDAWR